MEYIQVLKDYFGYTSFREGQEETVRSILSGRDVLCVMPTGAGKSICYQLPALVLPGITLVVSPLISLMKDQVSSLLQAGVKAAYFNSSLSPAQYLEVLRRAAQNQYKIIYLAPERLMAEHFLQLARELEISMLTVDEAHCISQWGQDFRPSYLLVRDFITSLETRPVVCAFTATATEKVRLDIEAQLGLSDPFRLTTGFNRPNLYYDVRKPGNKLATLLGLMSERREQSGIVYCSTRKAVEDVCQSLRTAGYAAAPYHAGLSDTVRQQSQEDFQFDRVRVIVATNAFGMGIDKANVSYVIHYNMPKNIESYYQEAGRAGRDGTPADCILLYSPQDVRTNQFLIEKSSEYQDELPAAEVEAQKAKDLELLKYMTWFSTTTDCYRRYILRYFGENAPSYCGDCGNCRREFETVDITVPAQKILSCIIRLSRQGRRFGKSTIVDILRGSKPAKLEQLSLTGLSTYGIMQDTATRTIYDMIDYLVAQGYLAVTGDQYPVLTAARKSAGLLGGDSTLEMKLPKAIAEEKHAAASGEDSSLMTQLKQLRMKLANAASVPAYIVFTDATLRDMCAKRPTSMAELLEVSGVGAKKAERFGRQFIDAILESENA